MKFPARFVLLRVAEIGADFEQLIEVLRLLERDLQLLRRKGLEHVIESPVAHALDGGFDRAEAGDHDDQRFFRVRLQLAQQIGAFAVGQADIQEKEVERVLGQQFAGHGDGPGGGHVVPLLAQHLLKVSTDDQIVFQNNDFLNRH